jgi:hypothetical protein
VLAGDDADVVEAALLLHMRLAPRGHEVLGSARESWDAAPRPAFETIEHRCGREPGAGGGDEIETSISAGRTAAGIGDAPADPGEPVFAGALLAERLLPPGEALALAERWITSGDGVQRRRGALLAILAGGPRSALEEAYAAEESPEIKRLQRLALAALGGGAAADPVAIELGVRALLAADGDIDPDTALGLLAAGHASALTVLTSQPRGDGWDEYRRSVQARAWLIERLVPSWHAAAGGAIAADPRSVRLHFDDLRALRLLTQRRLEFDAATRTYR